MRAAALALGVALTGCAPTTGQEAPAPAPEADIAYLGIGTRLMGDGIVSFAVSMTGARDSGDVETYARCAAARYALIRGYGFARHVRTRVAQEAGLWRGDAVYTVSPALPAGARTIDAEVTVADCVARGIPTI